MVNLLSPTLASTRGLRITDEPTAARHTGLVATRVTSSRMIGRAAELQQLEDALAAASSGRPSLAFVAGDSGVGKTRLVDELLRRAEASGAEILAGDAVELGEGELPYAALVVGAAGARPRRPSLPRRAASARPRRAGPPPPRAGRRGAGGRRGPTRPAQGRLFEAVLGLLDRLGSEAPVVLVLEDLHWADPSTRAFVAFLARSLCRERVLVVLTYRVDELHRRHPLRPLLAEIERDPDGAPHHARAAEPRRARRGARGHPRRRRPTTASLDRLYARSEGNPLFMEELLAAGVDGRGAMPATLRDALMVRIEQLTEPAQELLRVARRRPARRPRAARARSAAWTAASSSPRCARPSPATSSSPRPTTATPSATRSCARSSPTTCCRASAPSCTAPSPRALERRAADGPAGAQLAAGIAHHYAAAGDQRAALGASVRAAHGGRVRPRVRRGRARCSSARSSCGTASRTPRRSRAWTRSRCCTARATRSSPRATATARRRCCAPRSRWSTRRPSRAAPPRCSSASRWRTGAPAAPREALDTAERALALVEDGEPTPERATIYALVREDADAPGPLPRGDRGRPQGDRGGRGDRQPRRALGRAQRHGHLARRAGRGRGGHGRAAPRDRDRPRAGPPARARERAGQPRRRAAPRRPRPRGARGRPRRARRGAGPRQPRRLARRHDRRAARSSSASGTRPSALLPEREPPVPRQRARVRRAAPRRAGPRTRRHEEAAEHLARLADPVAASAEPQWHGALRRAARRAAPPPGRPRRRARRGRRGARPHRVLHRGRRRASPACRPRA